MLWRVCLPQDYSTRFCEDLNKTKMCLDFKNSATCKQGKESWSFGGNQVMILRDVSSSQLTTCIAVCTSEPQTVPQQPCMSQNHKGAANLRPIVRTQNKVSCMGKNWFSDEFWLDPESMSWCARWAPFWSRNATLHTTVMKSVGGRRRNLARQQDLRPRWTPFRWNVKCWPWRLRKSGVSKGEC